MKIHYVDGIGGWSETEGFDVPETDTNPLILRYAVENGQLVDKFPGQSNEEVIAADVAAEKSRCLTRMKVERRELLISLAYSKNQRIDSKIALESEFGNSTTALLQEKEDVITNLNALLSIVQNATTEQEIRNCNIS